MFRFLWLLFYFKHSFQELIPCVINREECIEELEDLNIADGDVVYKNVECLKKENETTRICAEKINNYEVKIII